MPFCLSYGELAHTTGLMYDLWRPEMTDTERQVFMGVFDEFLLKAALNCLTNPPWWANKEWSNWNGVCAEMEKLRIVHQKKKVPIARVYQGLEWAALADDEAFPRLRMAAAVPLHDVHAIAVDRLRAALKDNGAYLP